MFCCKSIGLAVVWGGTNPPSTTIGFLGTERNLFQPHSWNSKAGQTVLWMFPYINFFLLFGCLRSLSVPKHLKGERPLSSEPQLLTALICFPNMNYVGGSTTELGLPPTRWQPLKCDLQMLLMFSTMAEAEVVWLQVCCIFSCWENLFATLRNYLAIPTSRSVSPEIIFVEYLISFKYRSFLEEKKKTEAGPLAAPVDLTLSMWPEMTVSSVCSCYQLPGSGTTRGHHHLWLTLGFLGLYYL